MAEDQQIQNLIKSEGVHFEESDVITTTPGDFLIGGGRTVMDVLPSGAVLDRAILTLDIVAARNSNGGSNFLEMGGGPPYDMDIKVKNVQTATTLTLLNWRNQRADEFIRTPGSSTDHGVKFVIDVTSLMRAGFDDDLEVYLVCAANSNDLTLINTVGVTELYYHREGGWADQIKNLEDSQIIDFGTVAGTPVSGKTFETTLVGPNNQCFEDCVLLMLSGNTAKQARRITGYTITNGTVVLDDFLQQTPANGDALVVLPLYMSSILVASVWDQLQAAHAVSGSFGEAVTQIETDTANIYVDTQAIDGRLPTDPADQSQVEAAITASETNIIAEIDANEAKIDIVIADIGTHDTDIKALIGTPIADLITDINNRFDIVDADNLQNYNAIIQIQNNVSSVLVVPERLVRPDAGSKTYRLYVLNYDSAGNMEDFDALPNIKGDYISGGVLFASTPMTKPGGTTGEYYYDLAIAFNETLGNVAIQVDAIEGGLPRVIIATSEISDFDDELAEIKADTGAIYIKVDAGTPSPTIPAQITTHDTEIKAALAAMEIALTAEIDENQAILEVVRDDTIALITIPDPMVKWTGLTQIRTSDTSPLLTGAATIPLDQSSSSNMNQDGGEIIVDKGLATEEYLSYTGIVSSVMTLVSPTTEDHDDFALIQEVTRVQFNLELRRKNGAANIQADSAPTFLQVDTLGNTENSGSMSWDATSETYEGELVFTADARPGERPMTVSVVVDTIMRKYQADIELVDRPASDIQLAELQGNFVPKPYAFNEEGYLDLSGILVAWTDDMVGPIKDGSGKFATGIRVTAILMDGNYTPLLKRPHYENFTDVFGTYRGSLEAGKYMFTFYKDGLKWAEAIRYIDFP